MMKIILSYIVIIASCFFCSCNRNSAAKDTIKIKDSISELIFPVTIDIGSNMHRFSENKINDLMEDIEYVPLEFTSDCPIAGNSIPIITDQYIFLHSRELYVFSRTGNFIRKIGRAGKGPGEYGAHLLNFEIDVNNRLIYLRQYGGHLILKYDFEGNHIGDIRLPIPPSSEFGNILAIDQSAFFLAYGVMFPYWKEYKLGWCISSTGELLYTQPSYISNNLDHVSRNQSARQTLPYTGGHIRYKYKGSSMLYEPLNDTVFVVTSKGLKPRFILDFGKYKCPLEIMSNMGQYYDSKYTWVKQNGLIETDRYFFIQFICEERAYTGIFDKTNNAFSLKASEKYSGLGFDTKCEYLVNDFDGGLATIIPWTGAWAVSVDWITDHLTSEHFEKMKNKVKHPEKMEALKKMINGLNEEDNPVVIIYHFKK